MLFKINILCSLGPNSLIKQKKKLFIIFLLKTISFKGLLSTWAKVSNTLSVKSINPQTDVAQKDGLWNSTLCGDSDEDQHAAAAVLWADSSWVMVSALSHTWSLVRQGKEWLAVFWSVWFLGVSRSTGAQRPCVHHVSPNRAPPTCLEMDWVTGLHLVPPSVFHWTFLKEWGVPVRPLFYLRQSPVARTPFCWIRVRTVNLATQSISFWSRAENGRISGSVSKGENSKALSQKTSLA